MIIHGDCAEEIPKLEDESIHLIVTSPPYNVDLGNNKYNKCKYDYHNDNLPHNLYIRWLSHIFIDLCYEKLSSDGRIAIVIGEGKNGSIPTVSHLISTLSEVYTLMSTIIWNKNTTSNRAAWGSYLSPSCPSFPRPFEYIVILSKRKDRRLIRDGETDITREEFIRYAYGIWDVAPAKKDLHPAPFPFEIPYRLIKMLSWIGDTVLDPFCGSGTTGLAAKNRNFIGIEISEAYVRQCRIKDS